MEKVQPQVGHYLEPDEWRIGSVLEPDNGYKDSSFPGCQFRIRNEDHPHVTFAINLKITGKPRHYSTSNYRSRCKIEFVRDGEPSQFAGGWLYGLTNNPRPMDRPSRFD